MGEVNENMGMEEVKKKKKTGRRKRFLKRYWMESGIISSFTRVSFVLSEVLCIYVQSKHIYSIQIIYRRGA